MDKEDKHTNQNNDNHLGSCGPCELCNILDVDPINMEKNGGRLLTVPIKIDNVCYGKKVCAACILCDKNHKIVAFKVFTTILSNRNRCNKNDCGTIERTVVFVVPDDDIFDPDKLDVHIKANYIYPCD